MFKNLIRKELKCLNCNNVITIYRKINRNRTLGHIKTMYCYLCKKETQHVELGIYNTYFNDLDIVYK